MTFSPANALAFYVPETITFSKDQDQFIKQLTTQTEQVARSLNSKDIAIYDQVEILNGQKFPGATPQTKKSVFRKIFQFGAIAAGATLNIAHGITPIAQFTRIYGTCITDVVDYRPIPYASATLVTNQIEINVGALNVNIVNGATAPNITSGIIVLEYLKN